MVGRCLHITAEEILLRLASQQKSYCGILHLEVVYERKEVYSARR